MFNHSMARLTVILSCLLGMSGCAGIQHRDESEKEAAVPTAPVSAEGESNPAVVAAPAVQSRTPEASAEYHFSLAQSYVADGNADRAIEEYKLVLSYDPDSALVFTRIATEYIKKGSFAQAMEACKEALQRDPKFIDARLILAGLYAASRESELALIEYGKVLQFQPDHEEALVYRAQLLVEEGRGALASQQLRAFLKKNSESALAWFYLGKAEQRQEKFPSAVQAFKKALEVRPGFTQAALTLGYLYETRKMSAEALALYQEIYDQSQDLTAANRLATMYLKDEKYKEAVPFLDAIQQADPEDLNVRVKLGLVQMELKNWEQAIVAFKAILERNPDADRIHYYLGSLYEETGKMDLAAQALLSIKPDSKLYSDAVLHVAYQWKQDGKMKESRDLVSGAIAKSPRNPGLHLFIATVDEEQKDIPAAVGVLENAVNLFPEDEKVRYYLGSLYDRQGKTDRSLMQMEAILRLNAENVDALNYIGYTWTVQGVHLNDAEKMLRKAVKLRPDNGYVQDSWGWHLYVRGRVNEAIVELEKAAKLKPTEATILEHLADAYLRMNLREKAAHQYEEAARYAEDDSSRQKLHEKLTLVREEIAKRQASETPERMPAGQSAH